MAKTWVSLKSMTLSVRKPARNVHLCNSNYLKYTEQARPQANSTQVIVEG